MSGDGVKFPGSELIRRLIAAGIIPRNCRKWTLQLEAGDAATVTSETYLTYEQLATIADIATAHPEELRSRVIAILKDENSEIKIEGITL